MSEENSSINQKPEYYNAELGEVFQILDENFALIKVGKTLTLFDVCDFWLGPFRTASKDNKTMDSIVSIGGMVRFHATLLEPSEKIQYLASAVWKSDNTDFTSHNRPNPVLKHKIHDEKITIFKQVVESVSANLPNFEEISNQPPIDLKKYGIIRIVFYKGTKLEGGIIEFDLKKYCFFSSHSLKMKVKDGMKVYFNCARVKEAKSKVNFVALTVFENGEHPENPSNVKTKIEKNVEHFEKILKPINDKRFLEDPSHPDYPVINIPVPNEEPLVLKVLAQFKCLFKDQKSGILESKDLHKNLIYFEMADLNIDNVSDLPLIEAVSLLNNLTGIDVVCNVTEIKGSVINMAVLEKGIKVLGDLPKSAKDANRIDRKEKEMKPIQKDKIRLKRFEQSCELYRQNQVLSWADITRLEREKFQKTV